MTQEDKQLLLIDLCARSPYGLIISYTEFEYGIESKHTFSTLEVWNNEVKDGTALVVCDKGHSKYYIENIKPYLRPMSSMTEEEKKELLQIRPYMVFDDGTVKSAACNTFYQMAEVLDWLNAHHFDYRGLIERGLALEASEGMYEFKR